MRLPSRPHEELAAAVEEAGVDRDGRSLARVRAADSSWSPATSATTRPSAASLAGRGYPVTVVADDTAFPELFDLLRRQRESWGVPRSSRGATCGACSPSLRRNEILALLVDWGYRSDGIPVRLFDAWTTLPAGPAVLAAKTGATIAPLAIRRIARRSLPDRAARRVHRAVLRSGRHPARHPADRRRPPGRRSPPHPSSGTASSRCGPTTPPRRGRSRRAPGTRTRRWRRGGGRVAVTGTAATEQPVPAGESAPAPVTAAARRGPRLARHGRGGARRRGCPRPRWSPPPSPRASCGTGSRPRAPHQARANLRPRLRGPRRHGPRARAAARRAATDPDALERLVRRRLPPRGPLLPGGRPGRVVRPRDRAGEDRHRDADGVREALQHGGPVVIVGMHFGAIELPVVMLSHLVGGRVTAPMEIVDDPALAALVRDVPRPDRRQHHPARRTRAGRCSGALRGGDSVGLVVDRDLTGTGVDVPFFGHPAPIAAGPALLAQEIGVPMYVAAARRVGGGRYRCRVVRVPEPEGGTRRERLIGPRRRPSPRRSRRCSPTPRSSGGARSTRSGRTSDPGDGRRDDGRATAMSGDPADRLGRADLHIHTLASDGTAPVTEILDRVEREGVLDVIAITDHERIDAALAARRMALDRGLPDPGDRGRGDHAPAAATCWACSSSGRCRPCAASAGPSRRSTSRAASRSRPTRSSRTRCAPRRSLLRRLLDDADPAVRPDAIETFNPTALGRYWHETRRAVRRGARPGPGRQQRRPRRPRRSAAAGRRSRAGPRTSCGPPSWRAATSHHGSFHGTAGQLGDLRAPAAQVRGGTARAEVGGRRAPRRDRPRPRLPRRAPRGRRASSTPERRGRRGEDRARLAVRLPAAGRRDPARPLPLREPPAARPRRPDPDLVARPPARVRGRRHPAGQGLLDAGQRLGRAR